MVRVTYRLTELGDGRKFEVVGTGTTRADAVAEAGAKLKLTVGIVKSNSVSDILTGGEAGAPSADTQFSDAEILLRNGFAHTVAIHVENISTSYGTGTAGMLDLTNVDLLAFAAAYKDGAGAGGYSLYDGYFVR